MIKKIIFVHGGREAYPEIAAYRAFFAGAYETSEAQPKDLAARGDLSDTALWMIMGFYPRLPKAGLVIHDYRSLSVGRLWRLKDRVKRLFNARPSIRIFQNAAMRAALGFNDGVAECLLPMGVPPFVLDHRAAEAALKTVDFCYIGVLSAERKTEKMLASFVRRFGKTKSFHLYGTPEADLIARFKAYPNIVFCGRKSQVDVFAALAAARVAVNYFPCHHPHRMQTPTKLLEYAALGCRILCNEQPQSRAAAARYGMQCLWGKSADMFAAAPDNLESWPDNAGFDPAPLLWPSIIAESGIAALLEKEGGR